MHHSSEGALKNEALLNPERDDNKIWQASTVHVGIYSQSEAVVRVPNKQNKIAQPRYLSQKYHWYNPILLKIHDLHRFTFG